MRAHIDQRIQAGLASDYQPGDSEVIRNTIHQLEAYFAKQRAVFDIPLRLVGTTFQQKVWQQLMKIPYGKTCSYLDLSIALGNQKATRAAATANGANAISIIVPCHRVIGANGKLVGYAGGLSAKSKLLSLENANTATEQLRLF